MHIKFKYFLYYFIVQKKTPQISEEFLVFILVNFYFNFPFTKAITAPTIAPQKTVSAMSISII